MAVIEAIEPAFFAAEMTKLVSLGIEHGYVLGTLLIT
jgi:hypothetical protein